MQLFWKPREVVGVIVCEVIHFPCMYVCVCVCLHVHLHTLLHTHRHYKVKH